MSRSFSVIDLGPPSTSNAPSGARWRTRWFGQSGGWLGRDLPLYLYGCWSCDPYLKLVRRKHKYTNRCCCYSQRPPAHVLVGSKHNVDNQIHVVLPLSQTTNTHNPAVTAVRHSPGRSVSVRWDCLRCPTSVICDVGRLCVRSIAAFCFSLGNEMAVLGRRFLPPNIACPVARSPAPTLAPMRLGSCYIDRSTGTEYSKQKHQMPAHCRTPFRQLCCDRNLSTAE